MAQVRARSGRGREAGRGGAPAAQEGGPEGARREAEAHQDPAGRRRQAGRDREAARPAVHLRALVRRRPDGRERRLRAGRALGGEAGGRLAGDCEGGSRLREVGG